ARGDTRGDFLKLIDRPRVELAPRVTQLEPHESLAEFHFDFAADAEQRVPGILVKPAQASGRLPVVVALHGTGGDKQSQLPLLRELAGKGFIAIAIDGRYHGERTRAGKGSAEYQQAILRTWRERREH